MKTGKSIEWSHCCYTNCDEHNVKWCVQAWSRRLYGLISDLQDVPYFCNAVIEVHNALWYVHFKMANNSRPTCLSNHQHNLAASRPD